MTTTRNDTQKKSGMMVDSHHVDMLIGHYKKERWVQNSQKLGKADSLSTWYGLEELQAFIELAKENQADGIKMYFGVYPENFAPVPEFQGRQTVVLVATKKKTTDRGITNKDIYVKKDGKAEILGFNVGQLCPPWCGTGLPPDGDGPFGIDMEKIGISIVNSGNEIIVI
jgi:hypothetical protein